MREPAFLRKNKDKWLRYEEALFGENQETVAPSELAELYQELIDDLAYARTFYPKSQTTRYINGLAARTHLLIYKNRKDDRSKLVKFWTEDLPLTMFHARKYMMYALIVFTLSFAVGWVSVINKDSYFRDFFGDRYTNMTDANIRAGNPTAVYQDDEPFPMFVRIGLNNMLVSLGMFAAGIVFSIGSLIGLSFLGLRGVAGLFQTGVMVGAFLGNFYAEGVAYAIPVVWIHGTLEISAIIIAAGAGLMLGNSVLFPGTYKRGISVVRAGRAGAKIMFGLVPIIFTAAFLESYVTRYADMPVWVNYVIILLSAVVMIGYFVLYPFVVAQNEGLIKEASRERLSPIARLIQATTNSQP